MLVFVGYAIFNELEDVLGVTGVEAFNNPAIIPVFVVGSPDYLLAVLVHVINGSVCISVCTAGYHDDFATSIEEVFQGRR